MKRKKKDLYVCSCAERMLLEYGKGSPALIDSSFPRTTSSSQQTATQEKAGAMQSVQASCYEDATGLVLIPGTFPGLLATQCRSTPDGLAIDSYNCKLTYSQLERRVASMAMLLKSHGIACGDRVGICFHLSPSAIVTILASMALGAAVVPVDPHHPMCRKLKMFRKAHVEIVVVEDDDCGKELQTFELPIIRVEDIDPYSDQATHSLAILETGPKTDDDAFIAFTSGSTGVPKGIRQSQGSIVTMSKAIAKCLRVGQISRVAQLHPYIFDVSIMEIGMCLATGATLCIPKKRDMMLPSTGEVGRQLTRLNITHVTLSPTMLTTINPAEIATVQVLSVMGEPLGRGAVQKWATCPERTFYQLWGCTEASILQTITPPIVDGQHPQNIGNAIDGACRLWITDPINPNILLSDGQAGEIVVESRALAKGYLNQEEQTKEVFLDRAKWQDSRSRGRLYRSGDIGRKEVDGSVTFLGRRDGQMNYHGERVELGEIDYYLDHFRPSGVSDCFSDFLESTQTIVGFVCGSQMPQTSDVNPVLSWNEATVTKFRMDLFTKDLLRQGDLPEYMVPRFWIPIQKRPLTVSGKTDRSFLKSLLLRLGQTQWSEFEVCRNLI